MPSIREIASSVGFRGTPNQKVAEPSIDRSQPVIDNSDPTSPNLRTSIDCYVTGQYVGPKGKVLEVHQRYTLYVSYSKRTHAQTMAQARDRILADFQSKYGRNFNVANVYVPPLVVPQADAVVSKGSVEDVGFYYGTGLFRGMTKTERYSYDVTTERSKYSTNVKSVKGRYGYR